MSLDSKEKTHAPDPDKNIVHKLSTFQNPFEVLSKPNRISVPKPKPFVGDDSDANSWGIPTVVKYLKDVIELPQYEAEFLRFEVNGLALLCLANDVISQLNIQNRLHASKIALHCDRLRQKVFEKAAVSLPNKIEDWDIVHVASWLSMHMNMPPKGLKALREGLDGMKLLEMSEEELKIFLSTSMDDDLASKMQSLIETGRYGSDQYKGYIKSVSSERTQSDKPAGKKRKSKTLMSDRLSARAVRDPFTPQEELGDLEVVLEDSDDGIQDSPPPSYHSAAAKTSGKFSSAGVNSTDVPPKEPLGKSVTFKSPVQKLALTPKTAAPATQSLAKEAKDSTADEDVAGPKGAVKPSDPASLTPNPNTVAEEEDDLESAPQSEAEDSLVITEPPVLLAPILRKKDTTGEQPNDISKIILNHSHNNYLSEVIGHIVESNKSTVGTLQSLVLQLAREKKEADAELNKARAAALDSAVALELMKRDSDTAVSRIENIVRGISVNSKKTGEEQPPAATDRRLGDTTSTSMSLLVIPERDIDAAHKPMDTPMEKLVRNRYDVISSPKKLFLGDSLALTMEDTMAQQALEEKRWWTSCIDRYTNMEPVGTEFNESRMILSEVVMVWIKIGNRMLRDAVCDSREFSSPEIQKCLLGLRKSVLLALSSEMEPPGSTNKPRSPKHVPKSNSVVDAGKATVLSSSPNVGDVAVGMVFALGLVRKIMSRHPTKAESMNLSFLLRKSRHGDLPMIELSREDLRTLLEDFLNIDFSEWHKLEAVYQLLDPDKNGFVDFPQLLKTFHALCPLLDVFSNKLIAQRLCLIVLTVACNELGRSKKDLTEHLCELVTEKRGTVASFHAFLTSGALFRESARPSIQSPDISRMQDIEVIADILFELTSHFFLDKNKSSPISMTLSRWDLRQDVNTSSPNRRLRSSEKRDVPHIASSIDAMDYLRCNLRYVCSGIARCFRIYNSEGDRSVRMSTLTSVATLFVTHMSFRRTVLLRSGSSDGSVLSPFIAGSKLKSNNNKESGKSHPSFLLLPQMALAIAEGIEQQICAVLGVDRAEVALQKSDSMTTEDFELVMAQVLGIPLPVGRGEGLGVALSACQLDVEGYLMEVIAPEMLETPRMAIPQRLDTRSAKRLLKTSSSARMYGSSIPDEQNQQTKHKNDSGLESPLDILVDEYLTKLDSDAKNLKLMFSRLLKLREAADLIKRQSALSDPRKSSREEFPSTTKVWKEDVAAIFKTVSRLYQQFEADIKASDSQVSSSLSKARRELYDGVIEDADGSLQRKLDSVVSLEDHLTRCRTDGLKLCGVIVMLLR